MSAIRYRCTACGNLTRFDVTVTRRSRAYHHYSLGGELQIDDFELLSEDVESVSCRWCGTSANVVEHDDDGAEEPVPGEAVAGPDGAGPDGAASDDVASGAAGEST